MIGWAHHDGFLELIGLWVRPGYRGGQVAGQLVDFLRESVAGPAGDEIRLAVMESNTRALRFYERAGFMVLDRVARDTPPILVWMSLPALRG